MAAGKNNNSNSARISGAGRRAKGARFEHELAMRLRAVWPAISRSRHPGSTDATADRGDFSECGAWFIEAKKHERWLLPQWLRDIYSKKNRGQPWALIFAGNRSSLPETYVTIPLELFIQLMKTSPEIVEYEPYQWSTKPDPGKADAVASAQQQAQPTQQEAQDPGGQAGATREELLEVIETLRRNLVAGDKNLPDVGDAGG